MIEEHHNAKNSMLSLFSSRVDRNGSKFTNKLVQPRYRAAMTGSRHFSTAIQNELYAQINVLSNALASNFDSVGKGGEGSVCPTRSAVIREMLIELFGEAACAIDVVPVPLER